MIEPRYRKDYTGEFVIINTDIRLGIKQQRREWIDNPIINQQISGRAAVIVSDINRNRFDYKHLENHRGGLHGSLKLQTYGTGDTWKHLRLDFYCSTDRPTITRLAELDYPKNTTIYTSTRFCLMFPEKFYTVPYQPYIDDIATALYLAAFDGHREIFILGLTQQTHSSRKTWLNDVKEIIGAYHEHQFYILGVKSNIPGDLLDCPNVEAMDYRDFVKKCDI